MRHFHEANVSDMVSGERSRWNPSSKAVSFQCHLSQVVRQTLSVKMSRGTRKRERHKVYSHTGFKEAILERKESHLNYFPVWAIRDLINLYCI